MLTCLARQAPELTIPVGDVAVRGAVEAVAANVMAAVELVWDRVQVGIVGQRLMERGVKDCDLRQPDAEQLACSADAFQVARIVQRCQLNAILDPAEHFVGNEDRVRESFAAMHNPVSDGVQVGDAPHLANARILRGHPAENVVHGRSDVTHGRGRPVLLPILGLERDDRLSPYSIDGPAR